MKRIIRNEDGTSEILFDVTLKPWRRCVVIMAARMDEPFEIETRAGNLWGDAGDYLIRDDIGEYYPCKPDIFHKRYKRYKSRGLWHQLIKSVKL